jgi:hypothetical protein
MICGKELVRFLMISDAPYLGRLTRNTLLNLCRRLDVSAAMLHLTDGSAIVLKDEVNVHTETKLSLTLVPRQDDTAKCAIQGEPIVESGFRCHLICPSGSALQAQGFQSHACVPLTLMSMPIGALTALSRSPKEFTKAHIDYMIERGKRLVLAMHHIVYFPDLGSEWLDLEKMQTELHGDRDNGSASKSNQEAMDSLVDRVLAVENLSRQSPPSSLTRSLPKGINWLTLLRVCNYLEKHPGPISRKDLADALGFSDITAGHYLTYLTDTGVVRKEITYGQVGRPAFTYRLHPAHQSTAGDEIPVHRVSEPAGDDYSDYCTYLDS